LQTFGYQQNLRLIGCFQKKLGEHQKMRATQFDLFPGEDLKLHSIEALFEKAP
jgi:hypothetical protein